VRRHAEWHAVHCATAGTACCTLRRVARTLYAACRGRAATRPGTSSGCAEHARGSRSARCRASHVVAAVRGAQRCVRAPSAASPGPMWRILHAAQHVPTVGWHSTAQRPPCLIPLTGGIGPGSTVSTQGVPVRRQRSGHRARSRGRAELASVPQAFMESLPVAGGADADADATGDSEPVDAKALVQAAKEKVRALSSPPQRSATERRMHAVSYVHMTRCCDPPRRSFSSDGLTTASSYVVCCTLHASGHGLTPARAAPGLGLAPPHLHRDSACALPRGG
jgi:hypothetical protein